MIATRVMVNIDDLLQDCSNSIANVLELLQSCTKPLLCSLCFRGLWLVVWRCVAPVQWDVSPRWGAAADIEDPGTGHRLDGMSQEDDHVS